MRQAIKTKYLGPTNTKGTRVRASAYAGSIVVDWDYGIGNNENFEKAAMELIKKFEWHKHRDFVGIASGTAPTGQADECYHVLIYKENLNEIQNSEC